MNDNMNNVNNGMNNTNNGMNNGVNNMIPNGMKKCPTCGSPMAKTAKSCPICGAKNKNPTVLIIAIIVGVIFLLCCCGGGITIMSSKSDTSTTTGTSTPASSSDSLEDKSSTDVSTGETNYEISNTKFEYYTNSIGKTEYYGIVEITNTGSTNLYLKDCTFDLEDNTGHLLQTEDFISSVPDVIKPGEKGYFYNNIGSTTLDDGVSVSNGINLVPQVTVVEATGEATDLEVSDTELKYDSNYPVITGRIINTTNEEQNCYVQTIFYDKNGEVLAITGTNVYDIPANGKKSFENSGMFMNDNVTANTVGDYKTIAQVSYYQW
jgi:hypothetical protein